MNKNKEYLKTTNNFFLYKAASTLAKMLAIHKTNCNSWLFD